MYPTPERCRPYLREIAQLQARLDDPNPDWLISDAQAVRSSVVAVTTAMMTRMLGPEPDHSNDTETIRARAHYAAAAVSAIAYAQDPHFAGIMAEHWLLSREGKTAILARSLAHLWGEVTSDLPDGSCNGSLLMGIPPGHHGKSMRETLTETHLKRMDDAPFALASAMALGYLADLSEWQLSKPQQQALLESDLLKEILPRQLVQSARPYLWVRHPQDDHQGRYGVLPEKPGPGWSTSTYRQDLAPDAYIASRSGLAPEQRNRMLPIAPPEFLHLAEHRDRLRSQEDMPAAIQGHAGIARFVARAMDAAGFGIRFEDAGALDPCCDWGNRTIHMPPLERFDTQADYLAALLHEIGHAVGHERISALAYDLHGLSPQIRLQEECAADGFLLAFAREHPEIPVDLALFSFDQAKGTRWAYPITPEEVIRAAYRVGEDAYRRIEAGEPLAIWRYSDNLSREKTSTPLPHHGRSCQRSHRSRDANRDE